MKIKLCDRDVAAFKHAVKLVDDGADIMDAAEIVARRFNLDTPISIEAALIERLEELGEL